MEENDISQTELNRLIYHKSFLKAVSDNETRFKYLCEQDAQSLCSHYIFECKKCPVHRMFPTATCSIDDGTMIGENYHYKNRNANIRKFLQVLKNMKLWKLLNVKP